VTDRRRDVFPNNFVGDLVQTERGWTVVPPTCCPATVTAIRDGRSARSGAPATAGTWRGVVVATERAGVVMHVGRRGFDAPLVCGQDRFLTDIVV